MNQMLIAHLHSDDFFDVAHHPVAEFVAESITTLATCTDGTPNHLLRGQFTLRGITREIEFPILVATADGQRLTAQGVLDLDRTQFSSVYGSVDSSASSANTLSTTTSTFTSSSTPTSNRDTDNPVCAQSKNR